MPENTIIVWFRQDLRLAGNPALSYAMSKGLDVIAIYIDDPSDHETYPLNSASRVWLHHSLENLSQTLEKKLNVRLHYFQGDSQSVLQELFQELHPKAITWNRCYEPHRIERDSTIKQSFKPLCEVKTFNSGLLFEPWEILKADQSPYRVYTPFWNSLKNRTLNLHLDQLPKPQLNPSVYKPKKSASLHNLALLPEISWDKSVYSTWTAGEESAHKKLEQFLHQHLHEYAEQRNFPNIEATSSLSPHLHFGEISPKQVFNAIASYQDEYPQHTASIEVFKKEIVWREFAYSMLFHFPNTAHSPLDQRFLQFPWRKNYQKDLEAWKKGQTGIPLVDAGMRQLWKTGWMHNRVRMIVGSFLTKNLLIPWQEGEKWFRETLFDADLASNVFGWQWVSGSGADAAPYFRIFNPILQSEKFDKQGDYIRRWVPELAHIHDKNIHQPQHLAQNYPSAIVDLKTSRKIALDAFQQIKLKTT